jgi:hypothetical protein
MYLLFFHDLFFQGRVKTDLPAVKPNDMNNLMRGYVQHERGQFDKRTASIHRIQDPVILETNLEKIKIVSMIRVVLFLILIPT